MNRRSRATIFTLTSVSALVAFTLLVHAQNKEPGDHPTAKTSEAVAKPAIDGSAVLKCPVTGEPASLAVRMATDEGPVFFCCDECIPKYKADPAKYAAKVASQRLVLSKHPKMQVKCPISGEAIDGTTSAKIDGQRVRFCCKKCIKKFRHDPAKFKAALANSYTYQAKCPVSGEEIDPEVFVTSSSGKKVYFCCKGCDKKFLKDPAKYHASLVAQGMTLEPGEWKGLASDTGTDGHHGEGDEHGHGHHGEGHGQGHHGHGE